MPKRLVPNPFLILANNPKEPLHTVAARTNQEN